jgi:hypothetical protein
MLGSITTLYSPFRTINPPPPGMTTFNFGQFKVIFRRSRVQVFVGPGTTFI